jgi:regulator of replication initiation timing
MTNDERRRADDETILDEVLTDLMRERRALRAQLSACGDQIRDLNAENERLRDVLAQVNDHAFAKMQETAAANDKMRRAIEKLGAGDVQLGETMARLNAATIRADAAEDSLAAANALLAAVEPLVSPDNPRSGMRSAIRAHLAAQPATAPTRTEAEPCELTADEMVVHALIGATQAELRAELARRGLK